MLSRAGGRRGRARCGGETVKECNRRFLAVVAAAQRTPTLGDAMTTGAVNHARRGPAAVGPNRTPPPPPPRSTTRVIILVISRAVVALHHPTIARSSPFNRRHVLLDEENGRYSRGRRADEMPDGRGKIRRRAAEIFHSLIGCCADGGGGPVWRAISLSDLLV